ncbi:hypothetical protein [Endozoicomonas numazuensis]|uniref:Uncharacterized protein n=1 Tax=Endozoicomonas numazuensis TaxID=1137799 RepID=A0A081NDN0_9GAMM|nr:hypothetical protein [Endozoicomonas numazuensis]KEQ16553.1 hypothetical protein GZ78_22195 [Endozoicomonas numazuensis]
MDVQGLYSAMGYGKSYEADRAAVHSNIATAAKYTAKAACWFGIAAVCVALIPVDLVMKTGISLLAPEDGKSMGERTVSQHS